MLSEPGSQKPQFKVMTFDFPRPDSRSPLPLAVRLEAMQIGDLQLGPMPAEFPIEAPDVVEHECRWRDEKREVLARRLRFDPADDVVEVQCELALFVALSEGDGMNGGVVPSHRAEVSVGPERLLKRFAHGTAAYSQAVARGGYAAD